MVEWYKNDEKKLFDKSWSRDWLSYKSIISEKLNTEELNEISQDNVHDFFF